MRLFGPLYDRCLLWAAHRHAPSYLAALSASESVIFPVPPDVMLAPMTLAKPDRWIRYATICTVASVLGGMAGYAIGALLYDAVGQPILQFYGYADKFADFAARYNEWGAWIVFIAGVTPFPYKVITIASGVSGLDLVTFTVASVLARGLRFFIVAGLLYRFGPPIQAFIERRLGLLFTLFVVFLVGGFAALKLAG